jgi:hypothetical protein
MDEDDRRILYNSDVRGIVGEAWKASHPELPVAQRQEAGFWVSMTTERQPIMIPSPEDGGASRTYYYYTTDLAAACPVTDGSLTKLWLPGPDEHQTLCGEPVLAWFHTHPAGGEIVSTSSTGRVLYGRPEHSRRDMEIARSFGVRTYVISSSALYRYDPKADRAPRAVLSGEALTAYLNQAEEWECWGDFP